MQIDINFIIRTFYYSVVTHHSALLPRVSPISCEAACLGCAGQLWSPEADTDTVATGQPQPRRDPTPDICPVTGDPECDPVCPLKTGEWHLGVSDDTETLETGAAFLTRESSSQLLPIMHRRRWWWCLAAISGDCDTENVKRSSDSHPRSF